jgi:hypothetical protein
LEAYLSDSFKANCLKEMLGSKTEEVVEEWKVLHKEKLRLRWPC